MIKVAEKLIHQTQSIFMTAGCLMLMTAIATFFVDNRKDVKRANLRKAHLKKSMMASK